LISWLFCQTCIRDSSAAPAVSMGVKARIFFTFLLL
jgi:hypothetical protein